MSRLSRSKSYTNVYHIILRGINQQNIFYDKQDILKFKKEIKRTKEKYKYELYAYVLMNNHVHFIIKDTKNNLSMAIQGLTISYVMYFNKKYERFGHLFQNRFHSKNIEQMQYLFQCIKYIHNNPVKAGIGDLVQYKYSSYRDYVERTGLTDTEFILNLIGENEIEQNKNFIKLHQQEEERHDLQNEIEFEIRERLTDKEVIKWIKDRTKIQNITEIQKYNKDIRDKMIRDILEINKISSSQLSRIIGISPKIIQRAKR